MLGRHAWPHFPRSTELCKHVEQGSARHRLLTCHSADLVPQRPAASQPLYCWVSCVTRTFEHISTTPGKHLIAATPAAPPTPRPAPVPLPRLLQC